ncbi:MAG TPA: adenylate/guanylate cyclase domain-containing protein [Thermoanaerobaculia bacterium]|jgi:adenylate cyclase|nr:adenylate/guanylate cyclase domain-containing protein [Thermoanaerobaculia bacterium]
MAFRRRVVHGASEDRLQRLIHERLQPHANKQEIDQHIWDLFGEEWCIMATDLAGFSRGVAEFGIIHFLQTIYESERILIPVVERHDGILLKVEGDSFLVIFRNAQKAVRAAVEMQRTVYRYNHSRVPEEHVLLGVGLGYGKVLRIGDEEVYGMEVNSACILGESYAAAYGILVTQAVRERMGEDVQFEPFDYVPPGAVGTYRVLYSSSSEPLNGD